MIKTIEIGAQQFPSSWLVPDIPIFTDRKCFSVEHRGWRKRMLAWIRQRPDLFPKIQKDKKDINLRDLLDESVTSLWLTVRILSLFNGKVFHPEKPDPIDQLVYLILSQKMSRGAARKAFAALRHRFGSWNQVLEASPNEIEKLLALTDQSPNKAPSIIGVLTALKKFFNACSFESVGEWSNQDIENFLRSLPENIQENTCRLIIYTLRGLTPPLNTHVIRVLDRLGLYNGLGLSFHDLDHMTIEKLLVNAIPPELQYSLHINLLVHGREICKAKKPKCSLCPVSNFCKYFRTSISSEFTKSSKHTMVDLFCGAGGLSAGFRQAGFRTVLAVDQDPAAVQTFRLNHPEVPDGQVICADLRELRRSGFARVKDLIASETIDVLVGGPPCQGFSRAGWRSRGTGHRYEATDDDRNHLYQELVSLLHVLKPKVVLMENVPGIGEVRFRDGASFQDLAHEAMNNLGYKTTNWALNAAWYGVPQNRIRRVIIGSKLGSPPKQPRAKYRTVTDVEDHANLEPAISLMEAIGDLPQRGVNDGCWVTHHNLPESGQYSRYLKKYSILHPQSFLFSHVTRFQNEKDLERFGTLKPGETYMDLIAKRPDLENYRTDAFDDKYYRLAPDAPCRTIVAHLRRDGNSFIHPLQVRSLSVREAARIQSFPDTFIFTGCRGDQFEQIGNAVPPIMAEAMAKVILQHLRKHCVS